MSGGPPEREPAEAAAGRPEDDRDRAPAASGGDAGIDEERRRVVAWLWRLPVLVAAGAASWGVYEGVRTHFFKRRPDLTPDFVDGPVVPVAPLGRFDRDWAEATFFYEGTPALAVRLPGPIAGSTDAEGRHLAAFSRVCTHLGCIVNLNRDADAIAFAFNYRADGPQLVCPCHLSVFDPERAGRAVAGPAIAPLPRVRLAVDDGSVVATGIEAPPQG